MIGNNNSFTMAKAKTQKSNKDNKDNKDNKGNKSNKNLKDITKTDEWNTASWEYSRIIAEGMLPAMVTSVMGKLYETPQERIDIVKEIIGICPEYYPAMLDIGQYSLAMGKDKEAKKYFDSGLSLVEKHCSKKDYRKTMKEICDFLEIRFRYKMALEYYGPWLAAEKNKKERAYIYNSMAYCYDMVGNLNKAIEVEKKAISLHECADYQGDLGWSYIINGDAKNAKKALDSALKLDKNDETANANMEVYKWLNSNENKNFNDYLLREVDWDHINKLEDYDDDDDEDFGKYTAVIAEYNWCRLEAFKRDLLKNSEYSYTLAEKFDIYSTLKGFFNFVAKMCDEPFIYDRAGVIESNFDIIMHKFIFKTGDIDEKIFNDIYAGVLEFYKFLQRNKLKSKSDYDELKNTMLEMKSELKESMLKYNEVRHNPDYSEEEKEEIRDELFEGHHEFWCTI